MTKKQSVGSLDGHESPPATSTSDTLTTKQREAKSTEKKHSTVVVVHEPESSSEGGQAVVSPELAEVGISRRLVAEALGAVSISLVMASTERIHGSTLVGITVAVLFFLFGPVSGGHFHPVVTVAMGLLGRIRAELAWLYLIVQGVFSFAGFALGNALKPSPDEARKAVIKAQIDSLIGAHGDQVPWISKQWILLIFVPAVLVAVVLAARDRFEEKPAAGAWMGAATTVSLVGGYTSFPFASISAIIEHGDAHAFRAIPALLLFPLIGAYLGALLYRELIMPRPSLSATVHETQDDLSQDSEEAILEEDAEFTATRDSEDEIRQDSQQDPSS